MDHGTQNEYTRGKSTSKTFLTSQSYLLLQIDRVTMNNKQVDIPVELLDVRENFWQLAFKETPQQNEKRTQLMY
jgi:hypothetical protein